MSGALLHVHSDHQAFLDVQASSHVQHRAVPTHAPCTRGLELTSRVPRCPESIRYTRRDPTEQLSPRSTDPQGTGNVRYLRQTLPRPRERQTHVPSSISLSDHLTISFRSLCCLVRVCTCAYLSECLRVCIQVYIYMSFHKHVHQCRCVLLENMLFLLLLPLLRVILLLSRPCFAPHPKQTFQESFSSSDREISPQARRVRKKAFHRRVDKSLCR